MVWTELRALLMKQTIRLTDGDWADMAPYLITNKVTTLVNIKGLRQLLSECASGVVGDIWAGWVPEGKGPRDSTRVIYRCFS